MDFVVLKTHFGDFPSDLVAKIPNSQCRGLGFYPGSGKETRHAATKIEVPVCQTKTQCSQVNKQVLLLFFNLDFIVMELDN